MQRGERKRPARVKTPNRRVDPPVYGGLDQLTQLMEFICP